MKRVLLTFAFLLALATPALAQSDLTIGQFPIPATNTVGWRVHGNTTTVNTTIAGEIAAGSGYKTALTFAHGDYVVGGLSSSLTPIAGSTRPSTATSGVNYQRVAGAGHVVAVAIEASTAFTRGSAHAEAVVLRGGTGTATAMGLKSGAIGFGLPQTTYNVTTSARGIYTFYSTDVVGCYTNTEAGPTPTTLQLACTVIVTY